MVFIVKSGNTDFDWTDLTGRKIGFIDGWAYSSLCVSRESERITVCKQCDGYYFLVVNIALKRVRETSQDHRFTSESNTG